MTARERLEAVFTMFVKYIRFLQDDFGGRFLLLLTFMSFGVKGFASFAEHLSVLGYFKEQMHVDAAAYQRFDAIGNVGWVVKGILGAVSDAYPFMGYHKRYYMVGFSLVAGVAILSMTFLKHEASMAAVGALFLFVSNAGVAGLDTLCEGKYTEFMAKKPEGGSRIVSWILFWEASGGVAASALAGPVLNVVHADAVLWTVAPVVLLFSVPLLLGWLPEVPRRSHTITQRAAEGEEAAAIAKRWCPWFLPQMTAGNRSIVLLGIGVGLNAIAYVIISLLVKERTIVLAYLLLTCLPTIAISFRVLPAVTAKANLLMFLIKATNPTIHGALTYFYTAHGDCVANGPHFSDTFYETWTGIAGFGAQLLGVFCFQMFLSRAPFKRALNISVALTVVSGIFDVVIVRRWNIAAGVSDQVAYMFGNGIASPLIIMLGVMPAVILTSKVCPRGMESTSFALLAGITSLGSMVASSLGNILADVFKIRTVVTVLPDGTVLPCDFSELAWLVVLCGMVLPCLAFPAIHYLSPSRNLNDSFDDLLPLADDAVIDASSPMADTDVALYATFDSDVAARAQCAADSERGSYTEVRTGGGGGRTPKNNNGGDDGELRELLVSS